MKISVVAHPNSKNPRIEKDLLGTLHIYLKAPPVKSKANKEILAAIANHFKVKKPHVTLLNGAKSKYKTFKITT